MSDNTAVTAGSGTTVATDNVSGAHYQKVKIGIGTADSSVMIGVAEDTAHSSGDGGVPVFAVRAAAAADLSAGATDGDYEPLQVDALGKLWTTGSFAEDSAHSSGHVGHMVLAVREAAATDLSAGNTDGDYEPLQVDALGKLWVTGTFNEDAAHTTADKGHVMLAVRRDTAAVGSDTDGDYSTINVNNLGEVHTSAVGKYGRFVVNPTVDTSAYGDHDIIGGIQTIAGWARVTGGCAKLKALSIWTEDGEAFDGNIMFFAATPTGGTYADQGAATWAAADFTNFLGKVSFLATGFEVTGGDGIYTTTLDLPLPVTATSLFALIFSDGTPTFGAGTDLNIFLTAEY